MGKVFIPTRLRAGRRHFLSSKIDSWRTIHNFPERALASDAASILEGTRKEEKKWWQF
jgi:hypothetical protein